MYSHECSSDWGILSKTLHASSIGRNLALSPSMRRASHITVACGDDVGVCFFRFQAWVEASKCLHNIFSLSLGSSQLLVASGRSLRATNKVASGIFLFEVPICCVSAYWSIRKGDLSVLFMVP